jgi:hypothetical protein
MFSETIAISNNDADAAVNERRMASRPRTGDHIHDLKW